MYDPGLDEEIVQEGPGTIGTVVSSVQVMATVGYLGALVTAGLTALGAPVLAVPQDP